VWGKIRQALTASGRRGRLSVLALAAAAAGVIVLGVAAAAQQIAPEPPSSAIGAIPAPIPTGSNRAGDGPHSTGAATPTPITAPNAARMGPDKSATKALATKAPAKPMLVLPASKPIHLSIPAIGVDTKLTTVGKTDAGAIDVPSGAELNEAAWFDQSPPGQYGPAVIVGHIDSIHGPSVFFRLGALRPGDKVRVKRADGRTAVFTIDGLSQYPNRKRLPIQAIYGGDLDRAGLRLMTCTNFDSSIGHYRGNTVVFAHLTDIRKP
jgi:sortase (surface protein transpeptidase)